MKRKRIGIFGGTFDPPHYGHLGVARAALASGEVDEVWMMVSPLNPFKVDNLISSEADRLEMTRRALESLPPEERMRISVSDFETMLPQPTYTVTTLRALSSAWPDCLFRLIVGGDNLSAFKKWKNPEEILSNYGLIVYPRPGDSEWDPTLVPTGCIILNDVPLYQYSSTEIRAMALRDPDKLYKMVPESVAQYIFKHHLYVKR